MLIFFPDRTWTSHGLRKLQPQWGGVSPPLLPRGWYSLVRACSEPSEGSGPPLARREGKCGGGGERHRQVHAPRATQYD